MGIPIQAAIQTKELLHLTGAIHQAIRDLDRSIDLHPYVPKSDLERIRTDLNSALVQIYGF